MSAARLPAGHPTVADHELIALEIRSPEGRSPEIRRPRNGALFASEVVPIHVIHIPAGRPENGKRCLVDIAGRVW